MTWAIVADSSCNLRGYAPCAPSCTFATAPLKIEVAGEEYADDDELDVHALNARIAAEASASGSACPSAGEWVELLNTADNVIALTISSNLSGSYDAAMMARDIVLADDPAGTRSIAVIDSKSAGGPLEIAVVLIDRYLAAHPDATVPEVAQYAQDIFDNSQVLFSLSSYGNLTKAGRMPKVVGAVASTLSIRMLGTATPEGTITIVGPTRGDKKTYRKIIETMRADGFRGGMVFIDHVENPMGADHLRADIVSTWPEADVHVLPCGGLCSYYAEQTGLIVGYEWC